jgi:hypothetical protein
MSPAARKRISAAMKQRWAKWKGKSAPKKAKAAPKKHAGRKPMSAAMRKKRQSFASCTGLVYP